MIERKIILQKIKEFQVSEHVSGSLRNSGLSHIKLQRTPLGDKIIVFASRPGIIVGREGQNIKRLTESLKKGFELENPQIEISEVEDINLNANIVAERMAMSLERFGSVRFKGIAHKALQEVMNAGAHGVEIVISGKVPSTRAKCWRFYRGYLKKCGDIALTGVDTSHTTAKLKSGIIGIKVKIMPPSTKLPDEINLIETVEEVEEAKTGEKAEEKKEETKKKAEEKKTAEKKEAKTEEEESEAQKEIKENIKRLKEEKKKKAKEDNPENQEVKTPDENKPEEKEEPEEKAEEGQ